MPGIRSYRPAAFEHALNPYNRFIADSGFCRYPSHSLDKYPERMGAAFIHKGPRHDHVIHEVAGQKPVVRMNIGFCTYQAESIATALRIECKNPVDKFHPSPGKSE